MMQTPNGKTKPQTANSSQHDNNKPASKPRDSANGASVPALQVFLLLSDGTVSWTGQCGVESPIGQLGKQLWNSGCLEDPEVVREAFVEVTLDGKPFEGKVQDRSGNRYLLRIHPLPTHRQGQNAAVGWCYRFSKDLDALTQRELEVLRLVCGEHTSARIAKMLHVSEATVETHRQNIARKTGAKSVVGMVRAAIRGGLIDP